MKTTTTIADLMAQHRTLDKRHKMAAAKHLEERRSLLRSLGEELKVIRRSTGLTLIGMSKLLKISRGCLNAAESPESVNRYLSPETVFAYADAYLKVKNATTAIYLPRKNTK